MGCYSYSLPFWFAISGETVQFPRPISLRAFAKMSFSDRYLVQITLIWFVTHVRIIRIVTLVYCALKRWLDFAKDTHAKVLGRFKGNLKTLWILALLFPAWNQVNLRAYYTSNGQSQWANRTAAFIQASSKKCTHLSAANLGYYVVPQRFPNLFLWINSRIFCSFAPIRGCHHYEFKVSWVHSEDNEWTAAVQLRLPERGPFQATQLPAKILGPEAHEKRNSNEFKMNTRRTSARQGAKKHTII